MKNITKYKVLYLYLNLLHFYRHTRRTGIRCKAYPLTKWKSSQGFRIIPKRHVPFTPSMAWAGPCQRETDSMRCQLMWSPADVTHTAKDAQLWKVTKTRKCRNLGCNVETTRKHHWHLHRTRFQCKIMLQRSAVACHILHGTPGMRLKKNVAQQPGGWLVLREWKIKNIYKSKTCIGHYIFFFRLFTSGMVTANHLSPPIAIFCILNTCNN